MAQRRTSNSRLFICLAVLYIVVAVAIAIMTGNSIHQAIRMPMVMLVFWGSSQASAVVRTCRSMSLPNPEKRLKDFHNRIEQSKINLKKRGYDC